MEEIDLDDDRDDLLCEDCGCEVTEAECEDNGGLCDDCADFGGDDEEFEIEIDDLDADALLDDEDDEDDDEDVIGDNGRDFL